MYTYISYTDCFTSFKYCTCTANTDLFVQIWKCVNIDDDREYKITILVKH